MPDVTLTDLTWALATISKTRLMLALLTFIVGSASFAVSASNDAVYLSRDDFLAHHFAGQTPAPQLLWLTGKLREKASQILGHSPASARLRYWQQGQKRAWILEEIGKERPITAGFVVDDGVLNQVDVLIYRESRGWEIRNDFFTQQFRQARLDDDLRLDRDIDNISGATLSVSAMQRLARLALLLDQHLDNP